MKATGVVRRIDELGRIVIPKEIRKTLRIREGENLEIFINNDGDIILKKYSMLHKLGDFAQAFSDSIHTFIKHNIFITDTSTVIAASGPCKKEYLNKPISDELETFLTRRSSILEMHTKDITFIDEKEVTGTYIIRPIIALGDAVGLVVIFTSEERVNESEEKVAQIAAQFLAKHLEA